MPLPIRELYTQWLKDNGKGLATTAARLGAGAGTGYAIGSGALPTITEITDEKAKERAKVLGTILGAASAAIPGGVKPGLSGSIKSVAGATAVPYTVKTLMGIGGGRPESITSEVASGIADASKLQGRDAGVKLTANTISALPGTKALTNLGTGLVDDIPGAAKETTDLIIKKKAPEILKAIQENLVPGLIGGTVGFVGGEALGELGTSLFEGSPKGQSELELYKREQRRKKVGLLSGLILSNITAVAAPWLMYKYKQKQMNKTANAATDILKGYLANRAKELPYTLPLSAVSGGANYELTKKMNEGDLGAAAYKDRASGEAAARTAGILAAASTIALPRTGKIMESVAASPEVSSWGHAVDYPGNLKDKVIQDAVAVKEALKAAGTNGFWGEAIAETDPVKKSSEHFDRATNNMKEEVTNAALSSANKVFTPRLTEIGLKTVLPSVAGGVGGYVAGKGLGSVLAKLMFYPEPEEESRVAQYRRERSIRNASLFLGMLGGTAGAIGAPMLVQKFSPMSPYIPPKETDATESSNKLMKLVGGTINKATGDDTSQEAAYFNKEEYKNRKK